MTTPIKSRRFRLRRDNAGDADGPLFPERAAERAQALFDECADMPVSQGRTDTSAADDGPTENTEADRNSPSGGDTTPRHGSSDSPVSARSFILRKTSRASSRVGSSEPQEAPISELDNDSAPSPAGTHAIITRRSAQPLADSKAHEPKGGDDQPAAPSPEAPDPDKVASGSFDAIRQEGLTARQLRMAMRVAAQHGVRAGSAYEAISILRARGIDPFARSTMLDLVRSENSTEIANRPDPVPAVMPEPAMPAAPQDKMSRFAAEREKELRAIQKGIVRRRRKRFLLLGARLLAFVTLPTFLVTYYFYILATPMYATQSQFVIQQADPQGQMAGGLGGMMPSAAGLGLGGAQEATSVQAYLQSRGAMRRLNEEEGFKAHFQDTSLDMLRRLAPDATDEAAYKTYQRHVKIGYDPTEGIVRMEVIAASPEDSERFARALINYAEEHVDMMTQRLRDSQMRDARQSLADAEVALIEARRAAVEMQESSRVISGEVEVQLISQQIVALESELTQSRLSLQEMRNNARPNQARMQPLERRVLALEAEIGALRGSLTQGTGQDVSLARTQSQLIMAEAEVQTREMMRAQAMQSMETARIEVSRQLRYLALTVEPVAPDEATHPRQFEYSMLAFLIFCGIYLFMSMTVSILREQVAG